MAPGLPGGAPLQTFPHTLRALSGPHPTPSRRASVLLSQQEALSSLPPQAARPAQPRPSPGLFGAQLTPVPLPTGSRAPASQLESQVWPGMLAPTPCSPSFSPAFPGRRSQGCLKLGGPAFQKHLQAAVGDRCQLSPQGRGACPSFQEPTGTVISVSRGAILTPRGSFSGALHLTLIWAAGLKGSAINVRTLKGLGPKPWQPASMDQLRSSGDTQTPLQLWVRQALTLLSSCDLGQRT